MHISLEIITHDKKQTIEQCLLLRSQVFLGAYKQSRKISSSPCGVHSARYMRVMICETRRHFARRRRTIFAAGACSFSLCGTRRVPSRRRVSSCVPFRSFSTDSSFPEISRVSQNEFCIFHGKIVRKIVYNFYEMNDEVREEKIRPTNLFVCTRSLCIQERRTST